MYKVKLKHTKKLFLELDVPENASELTLDSKLEYDFTNFRIAEWLNKKRKNAGEYCMILLKGCSLVFNKDFNDLQLIDGTDILNMDYVYFHEHLEQLASGLFKKKRKNREELINSLENSITELWLYIGNLIKETQPNIQTRTFTYKGVEYGMPSYIMDENGNILSHASISYQQATKCMAINNNYAYQISYALTQDPEIEKSDKNKNFIFKRLVEEVAMLTWDQNEIPVDTTEFDIQFIKRRKHFEQIDYQSVVNLDYWFQTYMTELETDKRNKYFFESTYAPENMDEALAFEKAKKKGANILYNVGEEALTPRLLETGAFDQPGKSPREALYRSPMTDVVRFTSADNSNK